MDRRDFLKTTAAMSVAVALPASGATDGSLNYVGYVQTNVGAPPGTLCFFGKHTQWAYCPVDGKLYCYGGDGDWRLPDVGFKQQQSLNAVLSYDFSKGGLWKQESRQFGRVEDGTCPYYHDGCTWVYNSKDDHFYAIPGYQPPYVAANDPHRIMASDRGKVHKFNRKTGSWSAGPPANWVQEHWGGCYDSQRNRIWIQARGGNFGRLHWYDCASSTFGFVQLPSVPALPAYTGLGVELSTAAWTQRYNPVTDELICFDGYRGIIIGIRLRDLTPRIIASVPKLDPTSGEPVAAIEAALCISVKRQRAFISYPDPPQVVGSVTGVWVADLASGKTEHASFPPIANKPSSWTQGEYDETNDSLILVANVYDPQVWGRRFIQYKFNNTGAAKTKGAEAAMAVAWLKGVPPFHWIDVPNSQLTSYFTDGKGLNPGYLAELGILVPTKSDQLVRWGANKHGIRPVNPPLQAWPWSHHHQSFGGMSLDSGRYSKRPSNLLVGGGDAHWADNTVARFVLGVDAPYWEVGVLGCHQREYKNERPGQDTLMPGDDKRHYRMYDGSDRGGHTYFALWCIEQRNWHCRFGTHQYWPLDFGYSQTVSIADLGKKRWLSEERISDWSKWGRGAETPWKGKHPVTEDVYCLQGDHLICWRQATNTWELLYKRPIQWALDDACGGIAWEHDYLLFSSRDGALGGKHLWWVFEGKAKIDVKLIGPEAEKVREAGSRWCALEWNPDVRKYLFYQDDAVVYTLERVDTATFQVGRLAVTGAASPAREAANLRAGGVLNNWQYVPQLKGMIYRVDDRRPMKFFRTG